MGYLKIVVSICFAVVTFPASGDFNDGNKIHPQCTTNKNYVLGYVAGLHDRALNDGWAVRTFVSDTVTLKNSVVRMVHGFCVPEKVTLGQVSDVFCSYLAKNPKDRHKDASDLFSVAMIEAWPCP